MVKHFEYDLTPTEKKIWDHIKVGGEFELSELVGLLPNECYANAESVVSQHISNLIFSGANIERVKRGRRIYVPTKGLDFLLLPQKEKELYEALGTWQTSKALASIVYGDNSEKAIKRIVKLRYRLMQKTPMENRRSGRGNTRLWRLAS